MLRRVTWAGSRHLRVINRAIQSSGRREWSEKVRGNQIRGSLVNTTGKDLAEKAKRKTRSKLSGVVHRVRCCREA